MKLSARKDTDAIFWVLVLRRTEVVMAVHGSCFKCEGCSLCATTHLFLFLPPIASLGTASGPILSSQPPAVRRSTAGDSLFSPLLTKTSGFFFPRSQNSTIRISVDATMNLDGPKARNLSVPYSLKSKNSDFRDRGCFDAKFCRGA